MPSRLKSVRGCDDILAPNFEQIGSSIRAKDNFGAHRLQREREGHRDVQSMKLQNQAQTFWNCNTSDVSKFATESDNLGYVQCTQEHQAQQDFDFQLYSSGANIVQAPVAAVIEQTFRPASSSHEAKSMASNTCTSNIAYVSAIQMTLPPTDFETYDPQVDNKLRCSPNSFTLSEAPSDPSLLHASGFNQNGIWLGAPSPHSRLPSSTCSASPQHSCRRDSSPARGAKRSRSNSELEDSPAFWALTGGFQDEWPVDGDCMIPSTCQVTQLADEPLFQLSSNETSFDNTYDQYSVPNNNFNQLASPEHVCEDGTLPSLKQHRSLEPKRPESASATTSRKQGLATAAHHASPTVKAKHEPNDSDKPSESIPVTQGKGSFRAKGRMPHNQVERKYRESLNTQLEALRQVVPALQPPQKECAQVQTAEYDTEACASPPAIVGKPSKAMILAKATVYIKQLESEREVERKELEKLRQKMKAMDKLILSGTASSRRKCDQCKVLGWVKGLDLTEHNA